MKVFRYFALTEAKIPVVSNPVRSATESYLVIQGGEIPLGDPPTRVVVCGAGDLSVQGLGALDVSNQCSRRLCVQGLKALA